MKTRFNLWNESFQSYFNRLINKYKKQTFNKHFNFLHKAKKLRSYNRIPKSRLLRDDSSVIYPEWKYTSEFHSQLKDTVDETKDLIRNIDSDLDNIDRTLAWCKNFYMYLVFYYGENIFLMSHTNTNYMRWGKPITISIENKHQEITHFMIDVWPDRYLTHIDDKNLMRFYAYQYINSLIKKQNKHFENNLIYLIMQFVV